MVQSLEPQWTHPHRYDMSYTVKRTYGWLNALHVFCKCKSNQDYIMSNILNIQLLYTKTGGHSDLSLSQKGLMNANAFLCLAIPRCAWKPGGSPLATYCEGNLDTPISLAPFQAPAIICRTASSPAWQNFTFATEDESQWIPTHGWNPIISRQSG